MKKILSTLLALILVLTFSMNAVAAEASSNLKIYFMDEELQLGDRTPFIENGTTYVPIRPFLEALDFDIKWKSSEQQIIANDGDWVITIDLINSTITQDEETSPFRAHLKNNSTYAPIRELSEALMLDVTWNQAEKAVYLDFIEFDLYPEPSEGFLWKVEKNGNVVYLLGSIHVATNDMYPMRDKINEAFEESDVLVTEVDMLNGFTEEVQAEYAKGMLLSDGSTFKDNVSTSTYKAVEEILADLGIAMDGVNDMKTWAVSSIIDSFNSMDSYYDPAIGIDMYYSELAAERGIPNWELESIAFQGSLYDNFSKAYQETMLKQSISTYNEESYDSSINLLADMWAYGDLDILEELTASTMEDKQFYKVFIADRNDGMTDKVVEYLSSSNPQTVFVIAGSLHMVGPDGIVTQLEELGYTVTRL